MRLALSLLALSWVLPGMLYAQVAPQTDPQFPHVQSVTFEPGREVLLTMLPDMPLTVMLEAGETITGVTPGAGDTFSVRVSAQRNAFAVLPADEARAGTLEVTTATRSYNFALQVDQGGTAALLVNFVNAPASPGIFVEEEAVQQQGSTQIWYYRLRGDDEVRPASLSDDGIKTRIAYAPGQALPAVFAIGPTGEEEVVNGYMRDGEFVIDRVYDELVFRIDREKATARRNKAPEDTP